MPHLPLQNPGQMTRRLITFSDKTLRVPSRDADGRFATSGTLIDDDLELENNRTAFK